MKIKNLVLLMLCCMPSLRAECDEHTVLEQPYNFEMQRKKEQKSTTLGDAARITAGSACLIAAWMSYREARRFWIGLNEDSIMEKGIQRIQGLEIFKQIREKLLREQNDPAAVNIQLNQIAQDKAAMSSKFDVGEYVVLATVFAYFGFNLLAKGLHIIK